MEPANPSHLLHNHIYTILLDNGDPGKSWHWALYLHHPHTHITTSSVTGPQAKLPLISSQPDASAVIASELSASQPAPDFSGYKLHATNKNGPWVYERLSIPSPGIISDPDLVIISLIGFLDFSDPLHPDNDILYLEEYIRPPNIPIDVVPLADQQKELKFTCRVWWKEALRVLGAAGVFVKIKSEREVNDCPDGGGEGLRMGELGPRVSMRGPGIQQVDGIDSAETEMRNRARLVDWMREKGRDISPRWFVSKWVGPVDS